MSSFTKRVVTAAVTVPTLAAAGVVALVVTASAAVAGSNGNRANLYLSGTVCAPSRAFNPDVALAGLSSDQVSNAAVIIAAAGGWGLGYRAAVIGVMTAWTESTLTNVDHGDTAGPDSRGLFQQRDSWGPASVRMDPAGAAALFYQRLAIVDGWQTLPPWIAAQQVQHSAYPDGSNYAAHYQQAKALVAAITGIDPESATVIDGSGGFDIAT